MPQIMKRQIHKKVRIGFTFASPAQSARYNRRARGGGRASSALLQRFLCRRDRPRATAEILDSTARAALDNGTTRRSPFFVSSSSATRFQIDVLPRQRQNLALAHRSSKRKADSENHPHVRSGLSVFIPCSGILSSEQQEPLFFRAQPALSRFSLRGHLDVARRVPRLQAPIL